MHRTYWAIICVFRRTTSTADHIFRIHQTFEKKWEYSGATRRLVGDFNKAKYSGMREIYTIPLRLSPHETAAVNTLCR